MTQENLTICINHSTYQQLQQLAISQKSTINELVLESIKNYLKQNGIFETEAKNEQFGNFENAFFNLSTQLHLKNEFRQKISHSYRMDEAQLVQSLIEQVNFDQNKQSQIKNLANYLTNNLRTHKKKRDQSTLVQNLLQEFSLSTDEGIALMCLAEALLRIPDSKTRDELIRDKIRHGDWKSHLGHSPSLFVNAATWGLMLTGKLVSTHNENELTSFVTHIITKSGEPIIRKAVDMAMRLLGEQFVMGETIDKALANAVAAESIGFTYSYDMLGEAALTALDAQKYLDQYEKAIHAIGFKSSGQGVYNGAGISIKLSALHPKYSRAHLDRVHNELYPILLNLCKLAKQYDIGLNIDAEEADRLDISLDLLERLCFEPEIQSWQGLGFVIQAYQKRCPFVIDYLIDLAERSQRRLMIRLVKGAYWDSEIKKTQIDGFDNYPVYTKKAHTDLAYIVCAQKLLAYPNQIYPQFATHNAETLSTVYHLAGENYYPGQYEFQCLHGMGESLYAHIVGKTVDGKLNRPCRIYAPVGPHETLLAYLVRRLLENGANSSFVHRIADETVSLETLTQSPKQIVLETATLEGHIGLPNAHITLPKYIRGAQHINAKSIDLSCELSLLTLTEQLSELENSQYLASPILGITDRSVAVTDLKTDSASNQLRIIKNPAIHSDTVGRIKNSELSDIDNAFKIASLSLESWSSMPISTRAKLLEMTAELFESHMPSLINLLVREAGKTFINAINEIREAVDFLRYYSHIAQTHLSECPTSPQGIIVCISPWNFPLAIFTGQIAAALVTGNCVLAKPAEQTPLIAHLAVTLMLEAGIPQGVLQYLPGEGESTGAFLVQNQLTDGVIFTGSTAVAKIIHKQLTNRFNRHGVLPPLIAETGGINCMVVDSSALTEQVINDVMSSAFDSAGQRCSALRILCLQEDIAEQTLQMLRGAMAQSRVDKPNQLSTDIGSVIDNDAKMHIDAYIESMRAKGFKVYQAALNAADYVDTWQQGYYVLPTTIEVDAVSDVTTEIFGPVLHIIRFNKSQINELIKDINQLAYGLTFGIHSRIDESIHLLTKQVSAGNYYVNRNIVGAVVGVQPFGGDKLSGTGPKAGGPLYLFRLMAKIPFDAVYNTLADIDHMLTEHYVGNKQAICDRTERDNLLTNLHSLINHASLFTSILPNFNEIASQYLLHSQVGIMRCLISPTGESNKYLILPRDPIYSEAENLSDYVLQLLAISALGSRIVWQKNSYTEEILAMLPDNIKAHIILIDDIMSCIEKQPISLGGILYHGANNRLITLAHWAANNLNEILPVVGLSPNDTHITLEKFYIERVISTNTTASGGNASLMTLD